MGFLSFSLKASNLWLFESWLALGLVVGFWLAAAILRYFHVLRKEELRITAIVMFWTKLMFSPNTMSRYENERPDTPPRRRHVRLAVVGVAAWALLGFVIMSWT